MKDLRDLKDLTIHDRSAREHGAFAGWTVNFWRLHWCCGTELLTYGIAARVNTRDLAGWTPLHRAAYDVNFWRLCECCGT